MGKKMKWFKVALVCTLISTSVCAFAGNEGKKSNTIVNEPASVPHGMVLINPHFGTDRVTITLDSYAKHDRIVEFFNEKGESLGHVTVWAYSKERTFVSTLTEGRYIYHLQDGKNTYKGRLVIIN